MQVQTTQQASQAIDNVKEEGIDKNKSESKNEEEQDGKEEELKPNLSSIDLVNSNVSKEQIFKYCFLEDR